MPLVGLDISDTSVTFAELTMTRAGLKLGRYGEKELSPGVVERGQVNRPEELQEVLVFLRKKYGIIHVAASLPEEKAFLFRLELSGVRLEELRGAIELQLEEHVPIAANDATFDYEIIREPTAANNTYGIGVSVVPTSVARVYLDSLTASGLLPLAFELGSQAITRAVVPRGDKGTLMIVDIAATHTSLSIVSGGAVCFNSVLGSGGDDLLRALAKSPGVSDEEARRIKDEQGLLASEAAPHFSELILAAGALRDEIGKHFRYWNNHRGEKESPGRGAIEHIFFCGGEANVPGLIEYLASGLATTFGTANPWVNIAPFDTYIPPLTMKTAFRYGTALGLALRPFHHD